MTKIFQKNTPISHLEGTCLGFLDIDGKRYWDGRDLEGFDLNFGKI